jgi:hypothetical protein
MTRRYFGLAAIPIFSALAGCSSPDDPGASRDRGDAGAFAPATTGGTGPVAPPDPERTDWADPNTDPASDDILTGDEDVTGGDDDDADTIADDGAADNDPPNDGDLSVYRDPGTGPWQLVPSGELAERCRLDPARMDAAAGTIGTQFAVIRYGELCYEVSDRNRASSAYSVTKTLGALVTGIASYETRDIPRTGRRTGPLMDTDKATHWLDSVSYNNDAHLAHVLAMVAHNRDLSHGSKSYSYDTIGSTQINTLSTVISRAISQDAARLGTTTGGFARTFLFDAIGATGSSWRGTNFATSWSTTLHDMARVGLLILHQGVWNGRRLLDAGWVYKMTHPAFEDSNTAYGYLTWLVAREGAAGIGGSFGGNSHDDPCAPAAVWQSYPHGLSGAQDCEYSRNSCEQLHDVGVWSAQGLGGQFIVGHAGLDMVIVAKDYSGGGGPRGLWEALRPALVALDPVHQGNEAAFCSAYAAGDYAPDLPAPIVQPAD